MLMLGRRRKVIPSLWHKWGCWNPSPEFSICCSIWKRFCLHAESLWSSQQDEMYLMDGGAAEGLWRSRTWLPSWPPSWISSRIKNYVKTASIVNFLCLTYKITHKYFASVYPQDLHLLLKEFKTCIFTQKWLDHLLFMTSYLVTIETEHH